MDQNVLDPKYFKTQNIYGPIIFLDQLFFDQTFVMAQKILTSNFTPNWFSLHHKPKQSVANIRIYSNIRIFFAEYLIFEYEYQKIGTRIYSNIRINNNIGYEYIRIFVNSLRIYSNICQFIMNTMEYLNPDNKCYVM